MKAAKNLVVRMRDGVGLATDVYRPPGDDAAPALVFRSPYGRDTSVQSPDLAAYMRAGYAVVVQDTRGRFGSDGTFNPFVDEPNDGEDTIAWVAGQDWCTGEVGMAGASYYGATQWMAAARRPGGLRAIAPQITSASYYEGWSYQGGAFQLGFLLCWTLGNLALPDVARLMGRGEAGPEDLATLVGAIDGIDDLYRRTPLSGLPLLEERAPYYLEWLAHPSDDEFWRRTAPRERYEEVSVPSFNIGGWYDCFLGGTLANYRGMKEHGGSGAARRPRLVVGPWAHGLMWGEFPDTRFGVSANSMFFNITNQQIQFFDQHLRGRESQLDESHPVTLFIMGANAWRAEEDWPLPDTQFTRYYLHSNGRAGGEENDGQLSQEPPDDEPADVYLYDPRDPVATLGGQTFLPGFLIGANSGPRDQRPVESRRDVLCFTTAPLQEELEVTGPVTLTLFASSSAVDTDFTGKLVDVHPSGRAVILTEGILRARYRNSMATPELMTPGETYELAIDLWATANVFKAGHRIRLEVSSSNFPRFDRNSNTGGTIAEERESDFVVAVNRVFHDRARPSYVTLPVIDRRGRAGEKP
jgi:putative CocE/NonD family hydrolase